MQSLPINADFVQSLPGDPDSENIRRQLNNAIYAHVLPTSVRAPSLMAVSQEAAQLINLNSADCASDEFLQVFAGNKQLPGMQPYATCYGGHQFGNWAGQLGDGRAINLGEIETDQGHWTLQLKGAGPTPFSRTADGLAVMRSSIREFLCSEAMFHLGIPTTRALSLVNTGEQVMRDMLYDGNSAYEPGAVVCRLSPSFIRFGHFQILNARNELDLLRTLTNFVIERDFAHLSHLDPNSSERIVSWFAEVCLRTADLMVHWMRVGFVHGVMNTDNMSILGETIDYGPYGWLEDFDPDWTPNTTDAAQRRYRYGQQPAIGQWNLMQLANAILPLVGEAKPLEEALSAYANHYQSAWQSIMAAKLGLTTYDEQVVTQLMQLLTAAETDMTVFYRALGQISLTDDASLDKLAQAYYQQDQLTPALIAQQQSWLKLYRATLTGQGVAEDRRKSVMQQTNPKYVLRNYLAQMAIDEAHQGDYSMVNKLLDVLRHPYDEQPQHESFAEKRPEWARTKVGCSMLSCSS